MDEAAGHSLLPVAVLTGFLGSGKTTLLSRLLKRPEMADTAVVINEFGEIGLDHQLVESSSDNMVVLNSGCLCCTVRGDLVETLSDLFVRRAKGEIPNFKRVMVETTGLADPAPILHTLMTDPLMAARYRMDGVIVTIDAVNGQDTLDRQPESVKQAAVADRLIITKADIAEADAVTALETRLRALNPGAPIYRCVAGDIDPAKLLEAGLFKPDSKIPDVKAWLHEEAYAARAHGHDPSHHDHHGHDHDHPAGADQDPHDVNRHDARIHSFCLTFEEALPWQSVSGALDALVAYRGPDLLRMKAIVNVQGADKPVVLHGVQHVFHPPSMLAAWPDQDRRSRFVFIVRDIQESTIRKLFDAFLEQAREEEDGWRQAAENARRP